MFSTFSSCSQMPVVFYHSVIHGLGFFICEIKYSGHFKTPEKCCGSCFLHFLRVLKCTSCFIANRKHYACATRSSLPADRFHTEMGGRFAFTCYRCEISYRSEILAPVREPGGTHAGVTRADITFCGGIM